MGVFDDYLVHPELSLLDKTRIQAQVLVPVMRALRAELGKEKAARSSGARCAIGRSSCSPPSAMTSTAARGENGRRCTRRWATSPCAK
jgi:hypothetical protein